MIEHPHPLTKLVADVRAAEELLLREVERLATELSEQRHSAALLAGKDREIARLLARVQELEAHHRSAVEAKDEEIRSLIHRLKDFEVIQAKLEQVEAAVQTDDLKRIYGIGPVLEKKLQALGVTHFEQIGKWGDAEIESFQSQLTEARIRSDAWVKGAREQYLRKYRRPLV